MTDDSPKPGSGGERLSAVPLLRARVLQAFPTDPVPPYPPNLGLDPCGERDEYEGFIDRPWPAVEPRHLGTLGYDISPPIGFALERPPHLLNYYLPAFLLAGFEHDREHEIFDGILWQLREAMPPLGSHDPALPWWHGSTFFANYDREQVDCVIAALELVQLHSVDDCGSPCARSWHYEWELQDDLVLEGWRARRAML
ncbi:MAG: hypothetical protein NXI31_08225 [bacterium]|nr:hypothetical protein [bacterium]